MKRLLQGAPIIGGPGTVESYREVVGNGVLLTTSHDGYLARFGVMHRRVLMVAHDGARLDGEDTVSPAPGARIKGNDPAISGGSSAGDVAGLRRQSSAHLLYQGRAA